jgi:hypothetical protein
MEFLTEVFLNLDDQDLFNFWNINETTEALLDDNYIIEQRVEYRGYTKKAWDDLVADYSELRLTCLHYLDYVVIYGTLFLENSTNDPVLEEIVSCLYSDISRMYCNSFNTLINYVRRHSMWLIPSKFDHNNGTVQEWTSLNSGLPGPCNTSDRWILNPMLVKSIIVLLKRMRKRITSTDELAYMYRRVIEPLWTIGMKYSGSYSEAQIQELCDLLFWFWIPDPESANKPQVPTARQLFFSKEIIIAIICCSEHEALMNLLVASQPIHGAPYNYVAIYRFSVNCLNLMMLRKLIRAGHLQNGNFITELNHWLQKHKSSNDPQEREQFTEIIREILDADYTAETFKKIWNDSLLCNRVMNAHWPDFHRLYLITYSWVFEQRVKDNEDVSNMYLSPEFIHGINRTEEESLLKMLDFVEYPISIRVSERNGPRAFCERMLVKLGWLSLEQASLATRLHFHPKVSQVEYWSPNLE